eukprot:TRINITY_DN22928_c0_g1_i2.p1 TRINITY_DN22928_c0_g1~~TRINITY_DN22928_c0_g1_i2.p1  ORF type:complete len:1635 (+),score=507.40 TRINITY_DN22928_c0_g1_i2:53-4957(+)
MVLRSFAKGKGRDNRKAEGKKVTFQLPDRHQTAGFPPWSAEGRHAVLPEPVGRSFLNAQRRIQKKTNPQVLLVMPHLVEMVTIAYRLRRLGCKTTISRDGREAFRTWRARAQSNSEEPFDVVIIEREMDWIGGIEFVRMVREEEEEAYSEPVCLIALCHGGDRHQQVLQEGFTHFLKRPFALHPQTLCNLLLPSHMRRKSRAGLMSRKPAYKAIAALFATVEDATELIRVRLSSFRGTDGPDSPTSFSEFKASISTFEQAVTDLRSQVRTLEAELDTYEKLSIKDIMTENRHLKKELLLIKGHYQRRKEDVVRIRKMEHVKRNTTEASRAELIEHIDEMQKEIDTLRIDNELLEENMQKMYQSLASQSTISKVMHQMTLRQKRAQHLSPSPAQQSPVSPPLEPKKAAHVPSSVGKTAAKMRFLRLQTILEAYERQLMASAEHTTIDFQKGTLAKIKRYGDNVPMPAVNPRAAAKVAAVEEDIQGYMQEIGRGSEGKLLGSLLAPLQQIFTTQDTLYDELLRKQFKAMQEPTSWQSFSADYSRLTTDFIRQMEKSELRAFSMMREAFVNFITQYGDLVRIPASLVRPDTPDDDEDPQTPRRKALAMAGVAKSARKVKSFRKRDAQPQASDEAKQAMHQLQLAGERLAQLARENQDLKAEVAELKDQLDKRDHDVRMLFVSHHKAQKRLERLLEVRVAASKDELEAQLQEVRDELLDIKRRLKGRKSGLDLHISRTGLTSLPDGDDIDIDSDLFESETEATTEPFGGELADALEAAFTDVGSQNSTDDAIAETAAAALTEVVARAPAKARKSLLCVMGGGMDMERKSVLDALPVARANFVQMCRASLNRARASRDRRGSEGPEARQERLASVLADAMDPTAESSDEGGTEASGLQPGTPFRPPPPPTFEAPVLNVQTASHRGSLQDEAPVTPVDPQDDSAEPAAEAAASEAQQDDVPEAAPELEPPEEPAPPLPPVAPAPVKVPLAGGPSLMEIISAAAEALYYELATLRDVVMVGKRNYQQGTGNSIGKPMDGAAGWVRRCRRVVAQVQNRLHAPAALAARAELGQNALLVDGAPSPGGTFGWQMWWRLAFAVQSTLGIPATACTAWLGEEDALWRDRRRMVDDFLDKRERLQKAENAAKMLRRKEPRRKLMPAQIVRFGTSAAPKPDDELPSTTSDSLPLLNNTKMSGPPQLRAEQTATSEAGVEVSRLRAAMMQAILARNAEVQQQSTLQQAQPTQHGVQGRPPPLLQATGTDGIVAPESTKSKIQRMLRQAGSALTRLSPTKSSKGKVLASLMLLQGMRREEQDKDGLATLVDELSPSKRVNKLQETPDTQPSSQHFDLALQDPMPQPAPAVPPSPRRRPAPIRKPDQQFPVGILSPSSSGWVTSTSSQFLGWLSPAQQVAPGSSPPPVPPQKNTVQYTPATQTVLPLLPSPPTAAAADPAALPPILEAGHDAPAPESAQQSVTLPPIAPVPPKPEETEAPPRLPSKIRRPRRRSTEDKTPAKPPPHPDAPEATHSASVAAVIAVAWCAVRSSSLPSSLPSLQQPQTRRFFTTVDSAPKRPKAPQQPVRPSAPTAGRGRSTGGWLSAQRGITVPHQPPPSFAPRGPPKVGFFVSAPRTPPPATIAQPAAHQP